MTDPVTLEQLPSEVLSHIFLYLTAPKTLLALRLVNKSWESQVMLHALEHPNNAYGEGFIFKNLMHAQFVKGRLFQPNWRHLIAPQFYSAADRILILVNVARSQQIETDDIIAGFVGGLSGASLKVLLNHLHVLQQLPELVVQSGYWPQIYQRLAQIYCAPYHVENRTVRNAAFQLLNRCVTVAPSSLRTTILQLLVDHAQEIDNTDFHKLRTDDLSFIIDAVLEKMRTGLNDKQYSIYYHVLRSCIDYIKDPDFCYATLYEKCKETALKTHDSYFLRQFNFFWKYIPLPYRQQAIQACADGLNKSQTDADRIIYLNSLQAWFLAYPAAHFSDKIATPVITTLVKFTTETYSREVNFAAHNAFYESLSLQNEDCIMHLTLPMLMPKLEMKKGNNYFHKLKVIEIFKYIKSIHPDDWMSRIYTYFTCRSCDWRWFNASFRVSENTLSVVERFAQMLLELIPDRKLSQMTSGNCTPALPSRIRTPLARPDNATIVADVHHFLRCYPLFMSDSLQDYIGSLTSTELYDLVITPSTTHMNDAMVYRRICLLWLQCYQLQPTILPDLLPLILNTLNRLTQENEVIEDFVSGLLANGMLQTDNELLQATCRNLPETSLIKVTVNLMQRITAKQTDLRNDPVPLLRA